MSERTIRVLCVDDHAEIRRLFALVMRGYADLEDVGALDSTEQLEERIAELRPDVILLDLSMPGRRPLEALPVARERFPDVRFLVSSAYDDPAIVEAAIRAGATGFLVKGGSFDDLAEAIRKVARDETVLPPPPKRIPPSEI
jgi:DNA-binding NarL/FixJ family response regulator